MKWIQKIALYLFVTLLYANVNAQIILLSGFDQDSSAQYKFSLAKNVFEITRHSLTPINNYITLPQNNRFYHLHAIQLPNSSSLYSSAYISIPEWQKHDTLRVDLTDFDSNRQQYHFTNAGLIRTIFSKYFEKRYSKLNIKIYGIWKSISEKKLKRDIISGKIYNVPKSIRVEPDELARHGFQSLEEAWLSLIPHSFSYGNYHLIDTYIIHAGDNLEKIKGDIWDFSIIKYWSQSIFRNKFSPSFKDELKLEFDKIKTAAFPNYQRLKTLCLAYYHTSVTGLYELNESPHALSKEYLYQQLDSMPQDIYTLDLRKHINSLTTNPLESDYQFTNSDKETVPLRDYLHREWIILDFWATWCKPCIKSFPALYQFYQKYNDQLELLSLSADASYDVFERWVRKNGDGYTWPFLHIGSSGQLLRSLQVYAYPTYFIIHVQSGTVNGPYHKVNELEKFMGSLY